MVTEFQDSSEAQVYTAPDRINDADVSRHRLAALHPAVSTVACTALICGFNQVDVSKASAFTARQLHHPFGLALTCEAAVTIARGNRLWHELEPVSPDCAPALQLVPLSMTGVGEPGWTSVLACQDRCVRFLHRSTVLHQVGLSIWYSQGPASMLLSCRQMCKLTSMKGQSM